MEDNAERDHGRRRAARAFAERRAEQGLTQEQVARKANVVVRTVSNFETHGRWPNSRTRAQLEDALGWPLGEIARIAGLTSGDVLAEIRSLRARLAELEERVRDAG